jgi:hypothetical protein
MEYLMDESKKKLSVDDLDKLTGAKSVASFARFVAGSEPKNTLTIHEINGLSGGRVVASFARFVASGGQVVAENKDFETFDDVSTAEEFDALDKKLRENAKYREISS